MGSVIDRILPERIDGPNPLIARGGRAPEAA